MERISILCFLSLLKAGLFTEKPDVSRFDRNTPWLDIIKLAKEQTVTGIIAEAVAHLPKELQPNENIMEQLRMACIGNMRAHAIINQTLAEIIDFYRNKGIEGVLLKGQGLATLYPSPYMRQCGDIDFYVGRKNYNKAVEFAKMFSDDGNNEAESYKHYEFSYKGVTIELHRHAAMALRPWKRNALDYWCESMLDTKDNLRHFSVKNTVIALPPVEFDAIFIFYHAAYHLLAFEGVGLRQLCDWALVLHRYYKGIDIMRLQKVLNKLSLMKLWRIFGYIAVNSLGLPKNEMPFCSENVKEKAQKTLDYILESGNFGTAMRKKYGIKGLDSSIKGRWRTLKWHATCVSRVLSVAPIDVGSNLIYYTFTGPFRVLMRRLKRK